MTPTPNPNQAKACPLCCDGDADFLNVTPIYRWERFVLHCMDRHPELRPLDLWRFPMKQEKARG
jgi:hypothetical protein